MDNSNVRVIVYSLLADNEECGGRRKTEAAIFPPHPGTQRTETTVVDVVGLAHLIQRRGD